jgi:hypothetical protein
MNSYSKIKKPRDPKNVHMRMGIYHLGEKFQISSKKTLNDSHCIIMDDCTQVCKSISSWIEEDLLSIWNEVYSKDGSRRLQLCSDAYNILIEQMTMLHPELLQKRFSSRKKAMKRPPISE